MDKFEKVEKLRERANVSYEEAQKALEENDWDLLDAMVALEKTGRTEGPKQQEYSTSYDKQQDYISVKTTVEEQQKNKPRLGRSIGEIMQRCFRICRDNWFCVKRNDDLMIRIPLFVTIIILLFTWKIAIPVLLVALLFNFRYSIEGKDELKEVNAFMNSAGEAAQNLREGFQNARENSRNVYKNRNAAGNAESTADNRGTSHADGAGSSEFHADPGENGTEEAGDSHAVMVMEPAAVDTNHSADNA